MKELIEYLIKNWYFYRLLGMARKRFGAANVAPCETRGSLFECVCVFDSIGMIGMYYDTPDKSTRIELIKYKKVRKK